MRRARAALLASILCVYVGRAATTLDIYFIDVEGGQSTLFVTPAGESILVDTGYAGNNARDAGRIMSAVRDAGITQIDYLLITHFHPDHDGGIVELAPHIPIRTFVDHGGFSADARRDPRFNEYQAAYDGYVALRAKGRHLEPKPGDRLPLKGVELTIVSSAAATIDKPVAGAGQPNRLCPAAAPAAVEPLENPRSTGFHLRFGEFRFIDLGDLTGAPLFSLFCPNNLLGRAEPYLLPHHGGNDVAHPAYLAAVQPRAAIVNNGARKGGQSETFAMLHNVPGLDVWQLHRSELEGSRNFPDDRIANLDETTGHWIKMSASDDGSFRVTNQRTGVTKNYPRPPR